MRLEKVQARVSRNLADKSSLLIKVHALEVRLIVGEDLVGLWNDPDLRLSACIPPEYSGTEYG